MKEKKKDPAAIFLFVALIFSSLVGVYSVKNGEWIKDEGTLEELLLQATRVMNTALPLMINENLRLDSASGENGTLHYHYTFVNAPAYKIPPHKIKEDFWNGMVKGVCEDESMQMFLKREAMITYLYHGNDGKYITSLTVTPSQCNTL